MKLIDISKYLMLAALSFLTVSCGEDDDYQPGAPVSPDCMKVFFYGDNEHNYILDPESLGDDYSVELRVGRKNTSQSADVPVVVELADECFSIPSTVHFDAGAEEALLKVSFPGIPMRTQKQFHIRIAEEYTDPYDATIEGIGRFNGRILVSEWVKVIKDGLFYNGNMMYAYTDIWWLAGANRFRFSNFLDSGLELMFEIKSAAFSPSNTSTWKGTITPLNNFKRRNASSWYFYNDEADERARWTTSYGFEMKNIYFYDDSNPDIDLDLTGNYDGSQGYGGWCYCWGSCNDYIEFYWSDLNTEGYKD